MPQHNLSALVLSAWSISSTPSCSLSFLLSSSASSLLLLPRFSLFLFFHFILSSLLFFIPNFLFSSFLFPFSDPFLSCCIPLVSHSQFSRALVHSSSLSSLSLSFSLSLFFSCLLFVVPIISAITSSLLSFSSLLPVLPSDFLSWTDSHAESPVSRAISSHH